MIKHCSSFPSDVIISGNVHFAEDTYSGYVQLIENPAMSTFPASAVKMLKQSSNLCHGNNEGEGFHFSGDYTLTTVICSGRGTPLPLWLLRMLKTSATREEDFSRLVA